MLPIPNVTTQDGYAVGTEFTAPQVVAVDFVVSNAAVLYQLGHGWPGVQWGPEVFLPPKNVVLEREGVTGIRFRSAVKGVPAQVSGALVQRWDRGE